MGQSVRVPGAVLLAMTQIGRGLYDDAPIYDILHARGTSSEVDGLERMAAYARPHRKGRGTWLEPACGSGRYLRHAARRGYRVIGFDRNPEMIEYARARVPASRGRFFVGDMTRFAGEVGQGRVDFAFNLINTIRHLDTDRAMLAHFREVARALRPGGLYAVGLTLTSYGMEFPSEDVWEGSRGGLRVRQIVQYIPPLAEGDRAEQVHSHLVITRGDKEEHRDDAYTLRCYSQGQWLGLIGRSPLRLEAVVDEDGEPHDVGPSGYGIYLLANDDRAVTRSRSTG